MSQWSIPLLSVARFPAFTAVLEANLSPARSETRSTARSETRSMERSPLALAAFSTNFSNVLSMVGRKVWVWSDRTVDSFKRISKCDG